MRFIVDFVLTGRTAPLGPRGTPSGIRKQPVAGAVRVTATGLAGDEQGDRKHHGGSEKALHHYATDHYAFWRAELGDRTELGSPGAFGENIASMGVTEADICVGDVIRIGTATVQVSQGRQPCWKLNERFGEPTMARRVQESGRTGWYYRVLEEGLIEAGAAGEIIDRPAEGWSLSRLSHILYHDTRNFDALAQMAELEVLAQSWRDLARKRLESRSVESWTRRLVTPGR